MHFGEHVMVDGYGGSPTLLGEKRVVRESLDELCDLMKMYQLGKPQVYKAPDNHMKDPGGWSGFVVIAESHISIHTFPKRRFLTADIYTCKNGIDSNFFAEYLKRKFKLEDIELNYVRRGLKYPEQNIV